jgi:ketosteroid isomerase-like protein
VRVCTGRHRSLAHGLRVGLTPAIRNIYVDGDTVIVFFDANGTARDGKPYANTYAWFLDVRDGKVVKAHAFFDSVAFNDLWRRVSPAPTEPGS